MLVTGIFVAVLFIALLANHLQNGISPTPQPSTTVPSAIPSSTPSSPTPTTSTTSPSTPPPLASPSESISLSPSSSPTPSFTSPPITIPSFPVQTSPPIMLYPGEVREYNGTNLSSIGNVFENAIAGTQFVDKSNYTLSVSGLVDKPLQLSYDDVVGKHQIYQKIVTIHCVEGWSATILWEGVLVKDLIQDAKADPNASTIIFHATDGYSTALPRDYVINNNIMLAYKMNNLTIPPERGFPFELVAESKYGYKWIKWLNGIELSNDTNYLGFWESRGYSNDANVP